MRYSDRNAQLPCGCRGLGAKKIFESSVYHGRLIPWEQGDHTGRGYIYMVVFLKVWSLGHPHQNHTGLSKDADSSGGIPNLLTQESLRVVPGNLHFKFTPERIQL